MPAFVGDGRIGPVTLAAGATLTLDSRGDFAGLTTGPGATATRLSFVNLTGPVTGLAHVGEIDAQGAVSGVTVSGGVDRINAGSIGQVTTQSDPAGPATTLTVRVGAGGLAGPLLYGNQSATIYQVNGSGHVASLTAPGGEATHFSYDAHGLPASMTGPLGTWTFHYSADGRLLSETDPTGAVRTITYNAAGHAIGDTTTAPGGAVLAQTTFTRDADGNALTFTGPDGTTNFTYTAGRLSSETGPAGLAVSYAYDAAGNATTVTDSHGAAATSTYDADKRLLSRTFTAPGQDTLRLDYIYDAAGRLLTETRWSDAAGTIPAGSVAYQYDSAGHATRLRQYDPAGTLLQDYVYSYDAAGRPATETRNGLLTASYSYDAQGRVTGDGTRSYSYDVNGNRTLPGYQTGSGDRLLADGAWTYSYDAAGSLLGKTSTTTGETWTYAYDLDARLTHAEHHAAGGTLLLSADYKYDSSSQQTEQDVWTAAGTVVTKFAYAEGRLAAVLDAAGNVTARYLYGASGALVGIADAAGHISPVLTDARGSVRDVLAAAGSLHTDYGAFGETVGGTPASLGFGWQGMRFDPVTGLYRGSVARTYDPAVGRWTAPDPERFNGGAVNLYAFAANHPTTASDPSGLWSLRDAWNAVTTTVSEVATGAAQAVQELFRTIQAAGKDLIVRMYDVWQAGPNAVTWMITKAGEQLLAVGDQLIAAARDKAQAFVGYLEGFGRSFAELWEKVQQFGAAAQDVLWALVQDPGAVLSKLAASVGQGLKDFFWGLTDTLPNALMGWLTSKLGGSIPDVTNVNWIDKAQVGGWLLEFFHLNWEGIQGLLAQKLGAGNVALVTQAYEAVQTWATKGTAGVFTWLRAQAEELTPQALATKAIEAGVDYVVKNVVPEMVAKIVAKFEPTAAILTTIWNTLSWLSDQVEKFKGLAELGTRIAQKMGAVVHDVAGAGQQLARDVKGFLDGLVPVALEFVISQIPGLSDLPQVVGAVIEKVRNYPLDLASKAIDKVAGAVMTKLGLNNHPEYQGLIGEVVTFRVGTEEHRLWAVNRNGQPVVLRASTPGELDPEKDSKPGQKPKVAAGLQSLKAAVAAAIAAFKAKVQADAVSASQGVIKSLKVLSEYVSPDSLNACFAAGTKLLTRSGYKAIEQIQPGEEIASRDEHDPSGPVEYKRVEETFNRTGRILQLHLAGGALIRTSPEHPFYVEGLGWTDAASLQPGQRLATLLGESIAVEAVFDTDEHETLYNVRVADHHTYFVGCDEWGFSVWAHNACWYHGTHSGETVSTLGLDAVTFLDNFPEESDKGFFVTQNEAFARTAAAHKTSWVNFKKKVSYTPVLLVAEDAVIRPFLRAPAAALQGGEEGEMYIPVEKFKLVPRDAFRRIP